MDIVLVHLGPAKASHIKGNIRHLIREFPEIEITLITSPEAHTSLNNISAVSHFKYMRKYSDDVDLGSLNHNKQFRKGFWIYSLERIFAIEAWNRTRADNPFLHIESDVLLLPTFPFDSVESLKTLQWTKFNKEKDVATFIFSPNRGEFEWLADQVRELVKKNPAVTDMTALSEIASKSPRRISYFPSIFSMSNSEATEIFDPAPFGMWLTGQDPRNHKGLIRRFIKLSDSEEDPSRYKYSFNGKALKINCEGKDAILHNLHIHSKRNSYFSRFWKISLWIDVKLSAHSVFRNTISPRAIKLILSDFHARHPTSKSKIKTFLGLIFMKTN